MPNTTTGIDVDTEFERYNHTPASNSRTPRDRSMPTSAVLRRTPTTAHSNTTDTTSSLPERCARPTRSRRCTADGN